MAKHVQMTVEMSIIQNYMDLRKQIVNWFLRSYGNTRADLAERLGITRPTLNRKIKEFDFTPEELITILEIIQS